jgi:hypothetical protein
MYLICSKKSIPVAPDGPDGGVRRYRGGCFKAGSTTPNLRLAKVPIGLALK